MAVRGGGEGAGGQGAGGLSSATRASLGFIADSNVPCFLNGREVGVALRDFLVFFGLRAEGRSPVQLIRARRLASENAAGPRVTSKGKQRPRSSINVHQLRDVYCDH